jgi:hypothetical protein
MFQPVIPHPAHAGNSAAFAEVNQAGRFKRSFFQALRFLPRNFDIILCSHAVEEGSMKKILWITPGLLLASVLLLGGTITVSQPSGGNVVMGSSCPIVWTATGVTAHVKIQLIRPGGGLVGPLAGDLPPGSSPFAWTVAAPAVVGDQYRIRVHAKDGSADGESAIFTVVQGQTLPPPPPPVMLQLEAPNGGESFLLHHDCTISWKSIAPATVGKVELQLVRFNCCTIGVIKDNLPATGSFIWKAGEYPGNLAPAGQYLIRVRSMNDVKIFDESDAPFTLQALAVNVFKGKLLLKNGITVAGVYQNYPCQDTFPSNVSPPIPVSVLQSAWQQYNASGCGINQSAKVGVFWFPYQNIQVAALYRSRIHFPLSQYAGQGAKLKSAKLKMKRIHSIREDGNSGCGCSENLWVLEAPMASYVIPDIGQRIDVSLAATEFTRDVTGIVKKWLDGSLANNGLLLLGGELPCSGGRKCVSCYEASLILYME